MMRGILPAAVTPLDEAGRFLPAALEQLLSRLYGAGVHGVYLCGSTGEGMLESREQRQAIVETAMACTPRDRTVIVHVGAASLHEALALSSHAAKAGAHAISSLPPTSAQFSFADLRRYYEALAGGSDRLPTTTATNMTIIRRMVISDLPLKGSPLARRTYYARSRRPAPSRMRLPTCELGSDACRIGDDSSRSLLL